MTAWLHRIGTAVPRHAFTQDFALARMKEWMAGDPRARYLSRLYCHSGIEKRHTVLAASDKETIPLFYARDDHGQLAEPDTKRRNDLFIREATPLAIESARNVLDEAAGLGKHDITHVITVSCTGFFNPGVDFRLIRDLDLSPSVQRYHLGFMGCYAAIPALKMAAQFCEADPRAVVLIQLTELCSLHLQLGGGMDTLLANTLFADGAAAAIVSGRRPMSDAAAIRLDPFFSTLIPKGESDMAWDIGNTGFQIALSSYIPDIIGGDIRTILEPALFAAGSHADDIDLWAVHPGGKAILDRVQQEMLLEAGQIEDAREVLRAFGNMSSVTIMFVLARMLAAGRKESARILAMAFGPGLTVEAGLMTYVPAAALPKPLPADVDGRDSHA